MRAAVIPPERRRGAFAWRRYGLLLVGGLLVLCVLAAALFPEWIAPYSPYDLDVASMLQGPSAAHWLGTDELGRDVLSRAIHAARISVEVAVVAVGVGLLGGTLIGI
ncbi:MAG: transporter permease, partial [Geminicoccaceae bacterium]|nr:transporter permease [Geminicoccaceae bacterium]